PGTVRVPSTDFGPNEWLVDELYQRYLADPGSVDRAWWNFFADYPPAAASPQATTTPPASARPGQEAPAQVAPAPPEGGVGGTALARPPSEAALPGRAEVRLRGAAARAVTNMEASLGVPTATSVRAVPAKLLIDNRIVINNHLARGRGGK